MAAVVVVPDVLPLLVVAGSGCVVPVVEPLVEALVESLVVSFDVLEVAPPTVVFAVVSPVDSASDVSPVDSDEPPLELPSDPVKAHPASETTKNDKSARMTNLA